MILILPDTSLIDIARYLPYSSDRVHFASCCHRLKKTVLQEAYRSIDIHYFCEKSLRSLVEVLVDTPNLAQKVKHISLAKSKDPSCGTHQFNSHLPQLSINHSVSALIQTLTPSEEEYEQWTSAAIPKEECTRLGQDLWLSMLLNCTPNIKSLEMEWGGHTDISERFLAFLSQNNGLSCLTEISIQVPFDWANRFQLYKIAPFFRLPSMRKFKGVLMSDMRGQDKIGFTNLIAAKSSPVEHIYLAETGIYDGLEPLITACRRLKSFTHLARNTYYYIPRPNYTFSEFWIDDLVEPLTVAKDSLEHLCIDMYYPDDHYTLGWFGSLNDYTKLRTLHLRLRDLLHIDFPEGGIGQDFPTFITLPDMLPASLECIYVSDFDFPHLTGLRELQNLVSAKDRFPHLRVINIEAYLKFEEICLLSCDLRRACEEASIEFNVRYYETEVEHRGKPECESKDHWSHQFGNILEF